MKASSPGLAARSWRRSAAVTAPGGVTKNWVLVTCDLKEGRCQVRSSYGVMTKVRE